MTGFGAGLTEADDTIGELDVERIFPIGVAGFSVDGDEIAGVEDVERVVPNGTAGFSAGDVGEVDVGEGRAPNGVTAFSIGDVPIGVAGLSAAGDIRLPGVAGLGVDAGGGVEGLKGDDEGVGDEIVAAAGFAGGAAGFDGTGEVGCDEGGGSFSVTVPEITAGPERESGWDEAKAGLGS